MDVPYATMTCHFFGCCIFVGVGGRKGKPWKKGKTKENGRSNWWISDCFVLFSELTRWDGLQGPHYDSVMTFPAKQRVGKRGSFLFPALCQITRGAEYPSSGFFFLSIIINTFVFILVKASFFTLLFSLHGKGTLSLVSFFRTTRRD